MKEIFVILKEGKKESTNIYKEILYKNLCIVRVKSIGITTAE